MIEKKIYIDEKKIITLNRKLLATTEAREKDTKRVNKIIKILKWVFFIVFLLLFRIEIFNFFTSVKNKFLQSKLQVKLFILMIIAMIILAEWSNVKRCFRIVFLWLSRTLQNKN